MRVNARHVHAVVESLEHWIHAVEERRNADALALVDDVRRLSLVLAGLPGFKFLLARHKPMCGTDDPGQLIACVTAFLNAITVLAIPTARRPGSTVPWTRAPEPFRAPAGGLRSQS
jgi:hypothetical protein